MKQLNATFEKEGANALMRGSSVTYYGSIFYGGSYFYTYPLFKKWGHEYFDNKDDNTTLLYFASGFVSEYIALLLYFPFETVKVRIQTQSHDYKGLMDGMIDVFCKDGAKFIYQGYFWYAMHYSVNYSIQISFYETMLNIYKTSYSQ